MHLSRCTGNYGIFRRTSKGMAYAVGVDNADHRACKDGYQDCRVGGEG